MSVEIKDIYDLRLIRDNLDLDYIQVNDISLAITNVTEFFSTWTAKDYIVGEVIELGVFGARYYCHTATNGNFLSPDINTDHWNPITWSSLITYKKGSCVYHEVEAQICYAIQDISTGVDIYDTDYWVVIVNYLNRGWEPIGYTYSVLANLVYPFTGSYDGQNYKIKNLYCRPYLYYDYIEMGLFGIVENANLSNINIENSQIRSGFVHTTLSTTTSWIHTSGGLVGYAKNGTSIINCHVKDSTITAGEGQTSDGQWQYLNAGGLIGYTDKTVYISDCTVDNCDIAINATKAVSIGCGGLVANINWGQAHTDEISIENCSVKNCNVSTAGVTNAPCGGFSGANTVLIKNCFVENTSVTSSGQCGGFTGRIVGKGWSATAQGAIYNCYVKDCTVYGTGAVPGGFLARQNSGIVKDCYVIGGTAFGVTPAGGFAGDIVNNELNGFIAKIENCYCVNQPNGKGFITAYAKANGEGGTGTPTSANVINCFYDSDISGMSDTTGGTPKTTAELKTQSTFTDWDFSDIWSINSYNDGYPWLICFGKYYFDPAILNNLILIRNSFDNGQNNLHGNKIFTLPVASNKNSVAFLISLS